jgi:hypothetical protein
MQCLGYLVDDAHRAWGFQRAVGENRLQVAALDQSHVDVEAAIDFAVMMDGNDVGAVQSCRRVSFAAESPLKVLVLREVSR